MLSFYPDVRFVYLCTDAADRFVNMLYICKFEDVCLRSYFISIYMDSSTECCTYLLLQSYYEFAMNTTGDEFSLYTSFQGSTNQRKIILFIIGIYSMCPKYS